MAFGDQRFRHSQKPLVANLRAGKQLAQAGIGQKVDVIEIVFDVKLPAVGRWADQNGPNREAASDPGLPASRQQVQERRQQMRLDRKMAVRSLNPVLPSDSGGFGG